MAVILRRGMNREFGWRKPENRPSVPDVNTREWQLYPYTRVFSCFTERRIRRFSTGSPELPTPAERLCSPISRMFLAALRSRSWKTPQFSQIHSLSLKVRSLFSDPHSLHLLLDGSKRPIRMKFLPYQSHLYFNWRTNSPNPTSEMA